VKPGGEHPGARRLDLGIPCPDPLHDRIEYLRRGRVAVGLNDVELVLLHRNSSSTLSPPRGQPLTPYTNGLRLDRQVRRKSPGHHVENPAPASLYTYT
jgi:hypothetical protein